MFEKIIEQETKPREIHSLKDLTDLRDRILHSTGIEAEQLAYEAAGMFAGHLAEYLFKNIILDIKNDILHTCLHYRGSTMRFEVDYKLRTDAWQITEEEEDDRRAKEIEGRTRQALQRKEEIAKSIAEGLQFNGDWSEFYTQARNSPLAGMHAEELGTDAVDEEPGQVQK